MILFLSKYVSLAKNRYRHRTGRKKIRRMVYSDREKLNGRPDFSTFLLFARIFGRFFKCGFRQGKACFSGRPDFHKILALKNKGFTKKLYRHLIGRKKIRRMVYSDRDKLNGRPDFGTFPFFRHLFHSSFRSAGTVFVLFFRATFLA